MRRIPRRVPQRESVVGDLIATATRRNELLELLESPLDKHDFVDELGQSWSTIDRTMREMEVLGVVEYVSEGFVPTDAVERSWRSTRGSWTA